MAGIDQESFNKQLYDLLKVRGYNPVPKNNKNQNVGTPQEAHIFEFTFKKDGEEYGKVWTTIDDAQNVIVYFDSEQTESPEGQTRGVSYDDSWSGFLEHLKAWAQKKQLDFELANKDRVGDDMRQREYWKMKQKVDEGYYPMGKQASCNNSIPTVKIILQHTRKIEEGEQRHRNVAKIFLETQEGERFLAPTTRPGVAQVYARHLAEGGEPQDERWNHIKSICEEYNKMAGFVRATRNNEFSESVQPLVNEGINHYKKLRESLGKMRTKKGYNKYFESWTPALMEEESDESVAEMFVEETIDPRIESAMPILSRLKRTLPEMHLMPEVEQLEEWSNNIITGAILNESSLTENILKKIKAIRDKKKRIKEIDKELKRLDTEWHKAGPKHSEDWDFIDRKQAIRSKEDKLTKELLKLRKESFENKNNSLEESATSTYTPKRKPIDVELHELRRIDNPRDIKDEEFLKQIKQEGYVVLEHPETLKVYLYDTVGDFIDSEHDSIPDAIGYAKKNIYDYSMYEGMSNESQGPSGASADFGAQHYKDVAKLAKKEKERKRREEEEFLEKYKDELDDDNSLNEISKRKTKAYLKKARADAEKRAEYDYDMEHPKSHRFGNRITGIERAEDRLYGVDKEFDEDLDANQKRAGQLGPYEKIGSKGAVGKLVGESVEKLFAITVDGKEYKYGYEIDDEEDNSKIFHYVIDPEGKEHSMDWSPYDSPSEEDIQLWIEMGMPSRRDFGLNSPLRREYLEKHHQYMKEMATIKRFL